MRIRLCETLPKLKGTLRAQTDRLLLHDLDCAAERVRSSFRDQEGPGAEVGGGFDLILYIYNNRTLRPLLTKPSKTWVESI